MTPSEKNFCYDNVLKTSQLYGNDNVRCVATNKVDKDLDNKEEIAQSTNSYLELNEKFKEMTRSRDNWKYEAECHQDIAIEALKNNPTSKEWVSIESDNKPVRGQRIGD